MGHENRSARGHYQEYFNAVDRDRFEKAREEELDVLGYSFGA